MTFKTIKVIQMNKRTTKDRSEVGKTRDKN